MSSNNWPINTGRPGVQIAATATSQSVRIALDGGQVAADDVMIDNPGPNDVFIAAGGPAEVATTLSMRVAAGTMQPFQKGHTTHLAVVCRAGQTQTIVAHVGIGQ